MMRTFLSKFIYSDDLLIAINPGNVNTERFYLPSEIPDQLPEDFKDISVWFGPAMRKSKGNLKEDVAGTKVLWVDVDVEKPTPFMSTLPPSMLVHSGMGWHAYWVLSNPQEDMNTIERLNKILAQDVPGGDEGCFNINRILRVPGTTNLKYDAPKPVRLYLDQPIEYSVADIEVLERLPDNVKHKIRTGDRRGYRTRSERDWAIVVDLIKAGASDDLIRLLFHYQPCGDKSREEKEHYLEHTLEKAREEYKPATIQSKGGTGVQIIEGDDGFYVGGRTTRRITTFLFDPELLLDGSQSSNEDAIVGTITAEGFSWPNVTLGRSAFTSVAKMDRYLPVAAWQFLDNEQSLRALLPFLMQKLQSKGLPRVLATNTLGLHKIKGEWLYLGDKHTVSAENVWEGVKGPLAWLPLQREHPCLDLSPLPSKAYVQDLMGTVAELNEPETLWPIIGWYTMANLKPLCEQTGYRFPILNMAGTRGSGKTTLILRVFMKMFGQTEPKSYDAGTTRFVTLSLMGSSNAVPIAFSEFRYDAVLSFIRYILLSYDTGHDPRGRPDQTTVDYPLSAPFSVDGEDVIDDPAAKERIVVAILHPAAINEASKAYGSMNRFKESFNDSPGRYIIQQLLQRTGTIPDMIKASHAELTDTFKVILPDRVRRNYSVAWTGVKLWCEIAGMTPPSPEVLGLSINQIHDMNSGRSKTLADYMVEDIANAAAATSQGFRYKIMEQGKELWFQMASAHNYWATSRRRQGRAVLERDAIRNQLKEASYFIDTRAVDGVWMFGVSLQKAFDSGLDLPSFIDVQSVTLRVGRNNA